MNVKNWMIAAVPGIALVLLIVGACIRISADRPVRERRERSILKFLLLTMIFLGFMAAMALVVAELLDDRLDVIRATKGTGIPEAVKAWLWGWR